MASFRTLDDAERQRQRVLLRVDLNVPTENGKVTDATRIEAVAPTIKEIADKGGKVILLAHFGRPKGRDPKESLKPIAAAAARIVGRPIGFAEDCIGEVAEKAVAAMQPGDILCLENTRFHEGEAKNDAQFVAALAKLGDIYVNDAFSAAHRANASTEGLGHVLPAYAGRAMQAELDALEKALTAPQRPLAAIVGGAKISTKLDLLGNLLAKVETLIIGGGMANTFLAAQGKAIGKSLSESDLIPAGARHPRQGKADPARDRAAGRCGGGREIRRARALARRPGRRSGRGRDDPRHRAAHRSSTSSRCSRAARRSSGTARSALSKWNRSTAAPSRWRKRRRNLPRPASLSALPVAAIPLAALNAAGAAARFTYTSTAGGAFLEWLEGKALPGVEVLKLTPTPAPARR